MKTRNWHVHMSNHRLTLSNLCTKHIANCASLEFPSITDIRKKTPTILARSTCHIKQRHPPRGLLRRAWSSHGDLSEVWCDPSASCFSGGLVRVSNKACFHDSGEPLYEWPGEAEPKGISAKVCVSVWVLVVTLRLSSLWSVCQND